MQIIKNLSYFLLLIILLNSALLAQTNNNIPITGSPESIFNQGLKQLQKGNINEAIHLLEKLTDYNTQNPNYYIYLGYCHYVAGNYDQAVTVLNKSLEFNSNSLITHLILGEIYYQLNKIVVSREEFKKVVEMNDNIKLAHIRLYELYKDNNPTEANSHYIKIFQLPTTKIERFLPDIDKIGDITIPFNDNLVVLKDNNLERKIQTSKDMIDKIFQENVNSTNTNRSRNNYYSKK